MAESMGWTLSDWRCAYLEGGRSLEALSDLVLSIDDASPAWIEVATPAAIERQLQELGSHVARVGGDPSRLPLYGVPFAVKDNIDVAGFHTTVACRAFARRAESDATVVRRLKGAGAIVVGKTNLDQFATGLVGTRSPYGVVPNCFDAAYVGGGSSSGSAYVVAQGAVPFSLGTDTAGSGRVPAAFQNVVGYKPTKGRFSTRGVVPACRTLDCVSVFGLTLEDTVRVVRLLDAYDDEDPYSRRGIATPARPCRRVGIPADAEFFGDDRARCAFFRTVDDLTALGCGVEPIDFTPFRELAELLYASPWVVERAIVAGEVLRREPSAVDPVVRGILEGASSHTAQQAFRAEYRRAELARRIDRVFDVVDVMVVPTTPTIYRIADVAADPLGTNARLGTYTNFTNLADLCALALPGRFRDDGLPAGLTLLGRAHDERTLERVGALLRAGVRLPLGATGRTDYAEVSSQGNDSGDLQSIPVAVLGAHMSGMSLNRQLTSRGAELVETTRTSARYRLKLIPHATPEKPGLVRVSQQGRAIELELWRFPLASLGGFVAEISPPLGLGGIELEDGRWVKGFVCEPTAVASAVDISDFGGYRAYSVSRSPKR